MDNRWFWVFFLQASIIISFEFSWDKIYTKLAAPLPTWMEEQIEEDLSPFFGKKITSEDIRRTIQDVYAAPSGSLSGLVHYQIRNNQITVSSPSESDTDPRIAHVVEVLRDLGSRLPLPDIDFLAALWDSYDNLVYLENSHSPVFTICKLKGNRWGVLYPEFRHFSYRQRIVNDINWTSERSPWGDKRPLAFWRGMSSGFNYHLYTWDSKPRSRLALFSKERPDLLDAAFTSPYSLDETIKKWMEHYELFQPYSYQTDHVGYKYLISMDGNTFASNLWWQLLSNSVVLKSNSDYLEWFYKGISPFVHYVPYAPDLSDLEEVLAHLKAHDSETEQIGKEGRAFAQEHLSNEALAVYFYKLLWAYAGL